MTVISRRCFLIIRAFHGAPALFARGSIERSYGIACGKQEPSESDFNEAF